MVKTKYKNNKKLDDYLDNSDTKDYQSDKGYSLEELANHHNIAELMGDSQLDALSLKVKDEYEQDKQTRAYKEDKMEEAMKLALLVKEQKNYPFPNASNIKYPLLTSASIQFAARAYPAIVAPQGIVKAKVIGEDPEGIKAAMAKRVALYENYQLRDEMDDWVEGMDKLLHILPILGCAFKKTYFDGVAGIPVSELIYPKHLIVHNDSVSLEKAPRVSHELQLHPHEVTERIRSKIYLDINLKSSMGHGLENMDVNGSNDSYESGVDEDAAHVFVEQHRLLDLDNDGYPEPYIVTFHRDTGQVARVVSRFDEDDIEYSNKNEVLRIKAINFFTKYEFMPSPDGSFYGIGLGDLLLPINEAVNSTINQLMDAGHIQNTGGGFIGKGLRLKSGSMRFRPGEFKPVNSVGNDIRANIVPLPTPQPSAVLFQMLGLLIDAGKEISSVKDVLTGEARGKNESPTTVMALIEQGLKVFTAIYQRVHRSLRKELAKLHELNALFLDVNKYQEIVGPDGTLFDFDIEGTNVIPISDPNIVTDMQKSAKAQFLLQFIQYPGINGEEIMRRVFESFDIEDVDSLIMPPAPPMPDPKIELEAMKLENERIKTDILERESLAKIGKLEADTVLSYAKAEGEEVGSQLDTYKAEMEANKASREAVEAAGDFLTNEVEMNDESNESINIERVPGLDATGDNAGDIAGVNES